MLNTENFNVKVTQEKLIVYEGETSDNSIANFDIDVDTWNYLYIEYKDNEFKLYLNNQLKLSIYVACELSTKWDIIDIYYSIVKLLTYYFQWYFFEDNIRSNKSLEFEATKYASYLVNEYLVVNKNELHFIDSSYQQ